MRQVRIEIHDVRERVWTRVREETPKRVDFNVIIHSTGIWNQVFHKTASNILNPIRQATYNETSKP